MMRRTELLPLIAAGALVAVLLPATALGLLGTSDRGSGAAATPAPDTSVATPTAAVRARPRRSSSRPSSS